MPVPKPQSASRPPDTNSPAVPEAESQGFSPWVLTLKEDRIPGSPRVLFQKQPPRRLILKLFSCPELCLPRTGQHLPVQSGWGAQPSVSTSLPIPARSGLRNPSSLPLSQGRTLLSATCSGRKPSMPAQGLPLWPPAPSPPNFPNTNISPRLQTPV